MPSVAAIILELLSNVNKELLKFGLQREKNARKATAFRAGLGWTVQAMGILLLPIQSMITVWRHNDGKMESKEPLRLWERLWF